MTLGRIQIANPVFWIPSSVSANLGEHLEPLRTADPKFFRLDSHPSEWFILPLGGLRMAYEWDEGRARRTRLIKMASMWALMASALSVPVALLLTASSL
ncbi:hypothetical protein GFM29_29990 [Rhizobium leguminosarum bv. viciae]|nr:hypothetical protein [Rhizobium leguminosarum bv. viciae]